MRGRLSVRIYDGETDRYVTEYVSGLKFRKSAPGGHESASMTLNLPRATFPNLGPADRCWIYGPDGATVFGAGYTENPGDLAGKSGEAFELSVLGGSVLLKDRAEVLPYIDQSLDAWRTDDYHPQLASSSSTADQFPEGAGTREGKAAMLVQFNSGQVATTNSQVGAVYDAFKGSAMTFGGVAGWKDAGQTDANYQLEWVAEPFVAGDPLKSAGMNSLGGDMTVFANGTDVPAGKTCITFRLIRRTGGATNITTDTVWAAFGELFVFGHLVDRFGDPRTMDATLTHLSIPTSTPTPTQAYLLASDVAEDLLGRLLATCNPYTAVIDTSAAQIDQLAFLDASRPADVLAELVKFEPDFDYGIGASNANGLHDFWFRKWPTLPRYQISVRDGYDAPGGEEDLCNRILVEYTDPKGVSRTRLVGYYVPELGTTSPVNPDGTPNLSFSGRIKDADKISLPDGRGSEANALLVGTVTLEAKAHAPKSGTAVVRRPIQDLYTGRMVAPWDLEPGYPVLVEETGDTLRMTAMEYDDDSVSASLTLGTPLRDDEQLMVDALRGRKP